MKKILFLLVLLISTVFSADRASDSLALVAIWSSLEHPAWTNWGSAEPINTWDGVTIRNDRVTKIEQKNQTTLIGSLSPEIGNLTELDSLQFHNLAIGKLPSTMNSLTKLRYLNISGLSDSLFAVDTLRFPALEFFRIYTSYEDSLPIDFSASPNLTKLTLQKCSLLREIPQTIAGCTKLSLLEIGEIPLDTLPAWIGGLNSITTLLIYQTNLTTLPSTFGNLTNLEWLQLTNNKLTSLGFSVENMPNLLEIYLENNQLDSVPLSFTTRPVLEYLEMQNNRITSIPEALWTLPNLSAGDTYFYGNRLHFDDLKKAKAFFDAQSRPWFNHFKDQKNVTDQVIIGALADSVFTISQHIRGDEATITYLWERNGEFLNSDADMNDSLLINGLTAADTGRYVLHAKSTIDVNLSIYSDTVFVHMVTNTERFNDSLALVAIWNSLGQPAWTNWGSTEPINSWDGVTIRNDRVVKIDQKNQTNLTGSLAPEIGNLTELDSLQFHNLAIGTLPSTMNSLTKLRYLNISGLSDSLFAVDTLRFPALEFFRIYTSYEDSLPIDFSASPNLTRLTLQKCSLLTEIPQSITGCTKLALLEIGEIPFDTLPAWIGGINSITNLLVYKTNVTTLPAEIGNLTNLEWLDLTNNNLTSLGFSVENMPNLLEIYLENNQLDSVPLSFTTRPVLEYLEMQNNRITSIPEALWTLPNLSAGDTYFYGNRLHFDDLKKAKAFFDAQSRPWFNHFKDQKNVTDQVIIGAQADSVFTISQHIRGDEATITYLWERNGEFLNSDEDMNDSLLINGLTDADTGRYVLHASSSIDAGLQIYSDTVFVYKVDNLGRFNDSLALLAIWDSLGQPNWSNWNSSEPLEEWANLTMDTTSGRVIKFVAGSYWPQSAPLASEIGQLTELTHLQVQNLRLTYIPKEINNCTKIEYFGFKGAEDMLRFGDTIRIDSLKHLAINNLKNSEFPFNFNNSPVLYKIDMSYCSTFTAIPEEIRGVTTLANLRINNCPIAEIPTWIGELTELTDLSVNHANLSSTPAELANCTKMECLELNDNNLSSVDFDVQKMTTLYEIYLDQNKFTAVPEIFKDHPTLEYLYFEDNRITDVPMWVFHIPNISEVEFGGNLITTLPDSIIHLDRWPSLYFDNNLITELPEGWGGNKNLPSIMYFKNNLITHLPVSFDSLIDIPHRFEFEGNRLHFDDLERMKKIYYAYESMPQYWYYNFRYQKNISEKDTLWVTDGETRTVTATVRGTQDSITYRWYKNGTLDVVGFSADAKTLSLSNISDADTGWYCFEAKSSAASNLTMKSDTFYVRYNKAPVITSDTVVSATEDQPFSYVGTASNDNGAAKITYKNLPGWLSVDADSVKGVPDNAAGDTSFTMIASDGVLSDTLEVTLTVTQVNDAPILTTVDAKTTVEDTPLTVTLAMTNASDEENVLTDASIILGAGENYTVSGQTITPAANFNGTLTVPVTVTDGALSSATVQMIVAVTAVNDAPTFTTVDAQITTEDTPLTVTLAMTDASDVDNSLTDASIILGAGENYTVSGQTITPAINFTGTLTVPVTVTDGALSSATVNMTVAVTGTNDLPTITSSPVLTATEDNLWQYSVEASDVETASLIYAISGQPAGMSITDNVISWTPANGQLSSGEVTLTVSDDNVPAGTASQTFTITVTPVNDAPVLTTVDAQTTTEDTPLTMTLAMTDASDVDNILAETGIILGAGENYNVVGRTITPAANFVGVLTVPVTVTDGALNSATVNMTITVGGVNDAPVLTATTAQTTAEDTPLALTVAMTDAVDPDGDALTLIVGAGANYTVSGTTITPALNFHGALTVPVAVTDGALNSVTVNMTVTVTPVNDAPVLTATTAQVTKEETPVSLTLDMTNVTDVDSDVLTLLVGTGENYVIEGTTVNPVAGFVGTLTVPVSVSDGTLSSEIVNMTISVEPTIAIEKIEDDVKRSAPFAVVPNMITTESEAHFLIGEKLSGEGKIFVIDYLKDIIDEQNISVTDGGHYYWDLRNSSGVKVSCGMYLVVLELDGKIYKKKIAIKK